MKKYLWLVGVLLWPTLSHADEATTIVQRSVEAVGGLKKVQELTGGLWKTNGTVNGRPSQADFAGELPGKFRLESQRVIDGQKVTFLRIVNGEKGWIVEGSVVKPMTAGEIAGVKASFYHKQAVTTLAPLLEKDVTLKVVSNEPYKEQPATQILATKKGFPDLLLTFDNKSGFLVRSRMTDTDPKTDKPRQVEIEWSNHKEMGGIKMASRTKTYHDGKLFIETEITDFKRATNLPAETFAPPK